MVASQSIAVLAAALEPQTQGGRRELALLAVFSWSVGVFLYAAAGVFVAARLMLYPLDPADLTPPYWVAMGATAVHSLMGKAASISSLRGRKLELPGGAALLVTVHPSYLLRIPEAERKAEELKKFEADLRAVKAYVDRRGDEVRHGADPTHRAA